MEWVKINKTMEKMAAGALKKAINLISLRLENAILAESAENEKITIKNDELIKMATFVLGIAKESEERLESKKVGEDEQTITIVMEKEVEELAV